MSEARMCSIDASTKRTGLALFVNGDLNDHALIDISKYKGSTDERIREMGKLIMEYLDEWKPTMVYIEEPKGHQNVELVRKLSMVLGVVLGWCIDNDAYYQIVQPSVWRQWLGMDQGNKKREDLKIESIQAVQDMFGITLDDDTADAINIGVAVLNKYGE